ncbi:5377_t:CDS:2, partial [Ambispora leptoticha]
MNREQYQGPSAPQQKSTQQMHYLCADCGVENEIKPKEPLRCKECGH